MHSRLVYIDREGENDKLMKHARMRERKIGESLSDDILIEK